MGLTFLDYSIILAFLLLSLAIGWWYKNKASNSMSDFFLGGRNMPWYLAGISMVATTFAADTPLAVTELVAQSGISGNWLWWSFLSGGMLTTFFFARLWRKAEVITEVELIELRYSGKAAQWLRGFKAIYLGLFMNLMIMGWVNLALISILEVFFNIPAAEALPYVLAAMALAALYAALGGIWGVAVTDAVQFVIAMTGTILLAYFVLDHEQVGGIAGLKEQLPASKFNFFPSIGSAGDLGEGLSISIAAFLAYTTVQWWASWYPGAEPGGGGYVAQRMMSTPNEKQAIWSTLLFQIGHYCLRPWPWILVALASLILYPDLSDPKQGYVLAMRDFLPSGLKGLLLVAFLAAYLSTISTQLNWGAGYLVNDVYKRFIRPQSSEKQLVFSSRLCTVLLLILGAWATTFMDSISGVWSFIMECGAGLGGVLILRWYWWRINAWSEIAATLSPFLIYGGLYLWGPEWEFPFRFFLIVGGTTMIWILVTFLSPATAPETLQSFYAKVQPGGSWGDIPKTLGLTESQTKLGPLALSWFSAIVMVYSCLFATGYLIFENYQAFSCSVLTAAISLYVLRLAMKKSKLL